MSNNIVRGKRKLKHIITFIILVTYYFRKNVLLLFLGLCYTFINDRKCWNEKKISKV